MNLGSSAENERGEPKASPNPVRTIGANAVKAPARFRLEPDLKNLAE